MVISILGCNQAASTEYRVPSTRYGCTTLPLSSLKDLFHAVNNILYCERSHNIIIPRMTHFYWYLLIESCLFCYYLVLLTVVSNKLEVKHNNNA